RDAGRLEGLEAELGDSVVTTVTADLTRPDGPAAVVRAAAEAAPLTGVVNAAGVVAFGAVEQLDDDTLDEVLLLDLVAPVRLARAALAVLPEGGFLVQVRGARDGASTPPCPRARRAPAAHRDRPRDAPRGGRGAAAAAGPRARCRRGAHRPSPAG
ncbi:MAG TPA: SDR family oxidoreductase, partial [Humibacillus sp.]|nr:SDR family oxidoreductase [Humibacillus sp.]